MKYFDTFTGIGGFTRAIEQAYENIRNNTRINQTEGKLSSEGENSISRDSQSSDNKSESDALVCIGYSEIDKYASSIYQKHYPEHKNYGDITKITAEDLPDFDLFTGGFPCQSFSIAGKRMGFEDTRGTMFWHIVRILKIKRPRLLLLENVKGLLSHDSGRTFHTIISTLDELGYDLQWQVLNSKNFGVPQNRERVFIVGHLRGTSRPEVFPIGQDDQENIKSRQVCTSATISTRTGSTAGGQQFIRNPYNGKQSESETGTLGTSCGTTTGKTAQLLHSDMKIRRLTPIECERLQGFPDNWTEGISDTQRYKCCGNAVTVNVVQAIMERLL